MQVISDNEQPTSIRPYEEFSSQGTGLWKRTGPMMGPAAVIFDGADADTAQDLHLGLVAVEEGQALTHYERLILQAQPHAAPNLANQPTIIEAGERSAVEEQSNSMMQNIVNGLQGITPPALALILTATEFAKTKK